MERFTVKIASRYNNKWLFVKDEEKKFYRMPGGRAKHGEDIYSQVKNLLYEQLGVVEACIYRVNEVYFYADVKCIGTVPDDNGIDDIAEVHENNVYDVSAGSPMRVLSTAERNSFIKIHDWLFRRRRHLFKEPCVQFEKVCGAVPFKENDGVRYYLLVKNESGHIGFPKGHVEEKETEEETARREMFEETGLDIPLLDGFRYSFEYIIPKHNRRRRTIKLAVYFIAEFQDEAIKIQTSEISKWWLVPYKEALNILNKENDRELLRHANAWIDKLKKISK